MARRFSRDEEEKRPPPPHSSLIILARRIHHQALHPSIHNECPRAAPISARSVSGVFARFSSTNRSTRSGRGRPSPRRLRSARPKKGARPRTPLRVHPSECIRRPSQHRACVGGARFDALTSRGGGAFAPPLSLSLPPLSSCSHAKPSLMPPQQHTKRITRAGTSNINQDLERTPPLAPPRANPIGDCWLSLFLTN